MVLESQLPHKTVSVLFSVDRKQQVDDFAGQLNVENHSIDAFREKKSRRVVASTPEAAISGSVRWLVISCFKE
jgi:hypothetical protein